MAWTPTSLPKRTGVYTRFEDRAERTPQGGPRGTVAIPLKSADGEADSEKFYEVERVTEARELFGDDNVQSIEFAFLHGANKVLAYDLGETPDYDKYLEELLTREFNVLVLDNETDPQEQEKVITWLETARSEDKHVFAVFGGPASDDEDPELGNTRSATLEDDYAVNLINGVVRGDDEYSSGQFASAVAGLIAGNPLNETVTYKTVFADDVTKRLRNSQFETAIGAGSLALFNSGDQVKVEKGITTTGANIRSIQTRHTILNDVPRFLKTEVIAQIDNSEDGRDAVISLIKRYMETLENENIISSDEGEEFDVYVDPDNPPSEDAAFFVIEYTDQFSMERVFLTVARMG